MRKYKLETMSHEKFEINDDHYTNKLKKHVKEDIKLREKVDALNEEVASLRQKFLESEYENARLRMEESFKETKKELMQNNLIVKFVKMKLVPRTELLKAGATIDDWLGIAVLNGVRFKQKYLDRNFFRVIQGAE